MLGFGQHSRKATLITAQTKSTMPRRSSNKRIIGRGFPAQAILISAAVICAAFIIAKKNAPQPNLPEPIIVGQFDTIELPVPIAPVAVGVSVKDIEFKRVSFPRHQVPENAINDLASIIHSTTVAPLPASLPLFPENFSLTAQMKNPVTERIPAGMRAMTIKVDATSAVEGWAGSGTSVDVLLVTNNKTSVVAEKVKILSAERSVAPVEGASSPNVPSTITLLVTQDQCLAINTAIPLGKIAFALRSNNDDSNWIRASLSADYLSNARPDEKKTISGYFTVSGEKYALSDGRWIKTDEIPQFFAGNTDRR